MVVSQKVLSLLLKIGGDRVVGKIVSYAICFLFISVGIVLMSIAFATPGLNVLMATLGGSSTGLGTVGIKNIRKKAWRSEVK